MRKVFKASVALLCNVEMGASRCLAGMHNKKKQPCMKLHQ